MATAAKFVLPIPICLDYVVPLDVNATGNITVTISEVWSELKKNHLEFNICSAWLPWQRPLF
jgi:hypothetical protein